MIKNGVIWTRANGNPQPLANMTVLDDRVRQLLADTDSYPDRIQRLVQGDQLPQNVADYLIQQLGTVRRFIQQALG